MSSTTKPQRYNQNQPLRWPKWLVSNAQELELIGVMILVITVLYTPRELWRSYVLKNGLTSVATIQEVRSKDIVITYKVDNRLHRVVLSQPYPLSVGERFEMRYNKHWDNDVVVLFWRPLLNTPTPSLIHPNHVTEVRFRRGNVVEAEYNIGGENLTSYLYLPPDFNMNNLQKITLMYDALNPRVAYYLPNSGQ